MVPVLERSARLTDMCYGAIGWFRIMYSELWCLARRRAGPVIHPAAAQLREAVRVAYGGPAGHAWNTGLRKNNLIAAMMSIKSHVK